LRKAENIYNLADLYGALWFDAWGVLVEGRRAIEGAVELLNELNRRGQPWYILTNDASTTLEGAAKRFGDMGLPVSAAHIISSGSLLVEYFKQGGLRGFRCAVLGPADSVECVRQAGGVPVPFTEPFEVLLLMDEAGFPFLEGMQDALNSLFRSMDAGRMPHLLLPNPDYIFPNGPGTFGLAAGSMAVVFEAALQSRYGRHIEFIRLGKPWPTIFHAARARHPHLKPLMVGDQIRTDIRGANDAGVDSALLNGGVSMIELDTLDAADRPTWVLESLLRK